MDDAEATVEQLLYLSSAARRLSDLVAAAEAPVRYEVLRHLLRVSEETMIEVLEEAVGARLVARAADPFSYAPFDERTGVAVRAGMGDERVARLRGQIETARQRVFE